MAGSAQWDPLDELDDVAATILRDLAVARLGVISTGPERSDAPSAIARVLAETDEALRLAGFSDTVVKAHLAYAFDSIKRG
jgi:hypothetical protein